jgi:hypothetical protein
MVRWRIRSGVTRLGSCRLEYIGSGQQNPRSANALRLMSLNLHGDELRLATGQASDLLKLRLFFGAEGMVIFSFRIEFFMSVWKW